MEIIRIPHPGFGMEKIRIRDKHWVLVLFHGNAVSCGFLQILWYGIHRFYVILCLNFLSCDSSLKSPHPLCL
jgi:hypothetical protein